MIPSHECKQAEKISSIETQADRIEKELYVGREGRPPMTVRLDRCERIVNAQMYVASAVLISVIIGALVTVAKTVASAQSRGTQQHTLSE
jgi:hypothetical protein